MEIFEDILFTQTKDGVSFYEEKEGRMELVGRYNFETKKIQLANNCIVTLVQNISILDYIKSKTNE